MALKSVSVPDEYEPIFAKAEAAVSSYFADHKGDPSRGTVEIRGERYVLVRAAALSVEFFSLVRGLFGPGREAEADDFARNILFDLAHAIGKSDAHNFHVKMRLNDPIERLSAGPVHFSHAGWAFVDILPESHPTPDSNYYLLYDHPYSFEADAWTRAKRKPDFPVCIMNAGYSSGWCEASFGLPLTASEILCRAKGDPHCRFIMAPPDRIEEHVNRYAGTMPRLLRRKTRYLIPDFFARKRTEEALREAHHELERKVEERTAELVEANRRLQDEIAQRKREEERLRLLSRVVEQSSEGVSVVDLQHVVRLANEAFARMHGYEPDEVAGRPVSIYHTPDQMPAVEAALREAIEKGRYTGEIWHARRDGSTFPTFMSVSPLRDESGNVIGVIGTAQDITERKQAEEERERLNAQLREAHKLEAVGRFGRGVAHDFNNLMATVVGLTSNIRLSRKSDDPDYVKLTHIQEAAESASNLAHQLLLFAKGGTIRLHLLPFADVIKSALALIPPMMPPNVTLDSKIDPDLGEVECDQTQIQQVIINLCRNALEATPNGGRLTIKAENVTPSAPLNDAQPPLAVGQYVCLTVEDTGSGMDAETMKRIFDPFFTTKKHGHGLGLAAAYGVMAAHGGAISVASAPARGSTFRLWLPRADKRGKGPR